MAGVVVTETMRRKALAMGACEAPRVGTRVIDLSPDHIDWASRYLAGELRAVMPSVRRENVPTFHGSGSGYGDGSGYGYGSGYGDGSGSGSGSGYGDGDGYGYGSGYGDGSGYGSGDGSGYGYGSGSGYGYGSGKQDIVT